MVVECPFLRVAQFGFRRVGDQQVKVAQFNEWPWQVTLVIYDTIDVFLVKNFLPSTTLSRRTIFRFYIFICHN